MADKYVAYTHDYNDDIEVVGVFENEDDARECPGADDYWVAPYFTGAAVLRTVYTVSLPPQFEATDEFRVESFRSIAASNGPDVSPYGGLTVRGTDLEAVVVRAKFERKRILDERKAGK